MHRFVFTLVLVLLSVGVALAGGIPLRSLQPQVLKPADEPLISNAVVSAPMLEGAPFVRLAGNPANGDTFMVTNYDIGWNSPTNHYVVSYAPSPALPGTRAHFTGMYRPSASGTRQQYYVYYNGTKYLGAPTVPPTTRATGFGGIDVFQGGAADGFAAVASHQPAAVALNGAAGDTVFTFTNLGKQPPNQLDPKVHIDHASANQTIYVVTSGSNRNADHWVWKSDDYGTTWTFLDSLAKYAASSITAPETPATESLDPNFQVTPNGDLYVFATIRAAAAASGTLILPPVGTGTTKTVNRFGYFKSTNKGVSWTWTDAYLEGTRVSIVAGDTLDYGVPLSNTIAGNGLSKHDGLVDASGVVHLVMNGQAYHYIDTVNYHLVFSILYWNSSSKKWVNVSRSADTHNGINDSMLVNNGANSLRYAGGASGGPYGRSYPCIAYNPNGKDIFVAWIEPTIVGTRQDTLHGKWLNQVWYNRSNNSGATWVGPTQLTTSLTSGKYWLTVARELTKAGSSTTNLRAHLGYLADQDNRNGVQGDAGAVTTLLKPYIYHTVDFALTDVANSPEVPKAYSLAQNYPNPFNPSTKIVYSLPSRSDVKLTVYNVLGQEVATLVNEVKEAGNHEVDFSAAKVSSGVYFYTINAGQYVDTKKMVLMK